jgi:acyl-CoA synthetase (AMP-forming)/AMP-acid ligase II
VLTYAEFDVEAQRLARRLMACGAKPGDRVALHMHNCAEIAIAYFACFLAGVVAVPISARMKGPEIEYALEHSGSTMYVGQSEVMLEEISSSFPGVRQLLLDRLKPEIRSNVLSAITLPPVQEDDPAVILYTSGSTALPKGVVHSHRSFLNAARGLSISADGVIIIAMSMTHSMGLAMLLAGTAAGATSIVVSQFDADLLLDAIARHGATYMVGVPAMYRPLITAQEARPRDVTSIRRWLVTGDTLTTALQNDFTRQYGRPLHEIFGSTETGVIATNWACGTNRHGSFGRAAPEVDVAIIDTNGDAAPPGTEGEMVVRSPANMIGYWNDPIATAGALVDGWFHTGDLVSQDPDGYLCFRGRKKEIIVSGDTNVSPQEVEAILYQHSSVREAGVVGAADAILGERVVAFVSRWPHLKVTANELIVFVEKRLAAYKVPGEIVFVENLPKNTTGKVDRRALRERYAAADRPFSAPPPSNGVATG